jgi:hypothetical protein
MTAPQLTQYIQGQGSVSADGLNTFEQTTDIVSDLRTFIGVTGIQVSVRGQATVNDGGGGTFYWNASGLGPDDGINTIVPFGAATGVWSRLAASTGPAITPTVLLGGSGTYVTPKGARQLRIRMVGGGGSGGGANPNAFGADGNPGTATVFGPTTANPGAGGANYAVRAGGTGGAGPAMLRIAGGQGSGGGIYAGANPVQTQTTGLIGGNSYFGGAGGGGVGEAQPGGNAAANSGSGGGGGAYSDSHGGGNRSCWNGSGAAGEYVEILITSPLASYNYSVGAGGIGGAGACAGGNGGSGIIIVEAIF